MEYIYEYKNMQMEWDKYLVEHKLFPIKKEVKEDKMYLTFTDKIPKNEDLNIQAITKDYKTPSDIKLQKIQEILNS